MFVDRVDGLEKYSAANIIGIRPSDWESIKMNTDLFDNAGHVWRKNWKKVVNMTTASMRTSKFDILLKSSSQKHDNKNHRVFSLETSDNSAYPIPTTTQYDLKFRDFLYERADFLTLDFPPSSNNNSNSNSNSNNAVAEEKERKLSKLFLDSNISDSNKLYQL